LLGDYGLWFTVGIAIIATVNVIIASVFAVSRMSAMLSDISECFFLKNVSLGEKADKKK
jgi:hypothetical protein